MFKLVLHVGLLNTMKKSMCETGVLTILPDFTQKLLIIVLKTIKFIHFYTVIYF